MSLRDKLRDFGRRDVMTGMFEKFGVLENPFPASNQSLNNPHFPQPEADGKAESSILTFFHDQRSQVLVVEGTQGVGKTNFLNYFEGEIRDALRGSEEYFVVRYLPDPEASFDSATRRLFEEMGVGHLHRLAQKLRDDSSPIQEANSYDMRSMLHALRSGEGAAETALSWLLGMRLLKVHREKLDVRFRLDTVEATTAALRDLVQVSEKAGVLKGIFLLLDELEKQGGVLGPRAIVRYLSSLRALVDALPRLLLLMVAITPDALRRYSESLPALRGRLQHRVPLKSLTSVDDAVALAEFYVENKRRKARQGGSPQDEGGRSDILNRDVLENCYWRLHEQGRTGEGVRHREFLHKLHMQAEKVLWNG